MNSEFSNGLISVLVPVYNRFQYIAETIESIYSQSYQNVEIIAIDDGSTDGSYEYLLTQEKEGKIRLLKHFNRVNKGQSASLNLGLENANGEYVAILDSDDLFEKNKLEVQVGFLVANPNYGLVYSDGKAIDGKGNYLYDITGKYENDPNDPNAILLDCYFLLPQNSLVRHECYKEVGKFNEHYRAAQDHDMLIRICEVTNIAYVPEVVFKYRKHDDSISSKGLYNRWSTGFKILNAAKARYPYRSSTIRKRRAVLHFRMYEVYSAGSADRNLLKSFVHLLYAGILDPIRATKHLFGK